MSARNDFPASVRRSVWAQVFATAWSGFKPVRTLCEHANYRDHMLERETRTQEAAEAANRAVDALSGVSVDSARLSSDSPVEAFRALKLSLELAVKSEFQDAERRDVAAALVALGTTLGAKTAAGGAE